MKSLRIIFLLALLISACKTTRYVPPVTSIQRSEYIAAYSDIAIREMRRTGIPASIKMAQAILESGDGNSTLARRGNNHFGIKCHDWSGRRIYHDDDSRNECFRRYNDPEESFLDHSDFLTGRPRYAGLFKLDPYDYKAWATGLKAAGYATNPQYDRILIRIIEDNLLYRLDTGSGIAALSGEIAREGKTTMAETSSIASREVLTRNRVKYIVSREGDTFESITREMGLMKWELSRYNDLPANSEIQPGEIIYLQPKRNRAQRGTEIHIIQEGEKMHDVSQFYGIRLDRLRSRNFIQEGQEPSPGDTVYLRRDNPFPDTSRSFIPVYDL